MADAKRFPRGCVASPHYLASSAGLAVLAGGGNAMDAAVATNLVLGVAAPYMCGYGGDLFAMVWANGDMHAYNGSGRAPAEATVEAVGRVIGSDEMPRSGPFTVTVPGAVEGWFTLLERFGTRSFDELAGPAAAYARDGVPLSSAIRAAFERSANAFPEPRGDEWRSIYGSGDAVLRQPDLARTIEALCAHGPDVYYRGEIAAAIAETLGRFGSLMTTADLAAHTGDWVTPLRTTYRGIEVFEHPPNSQGVAALEALNIVEGLDIGAPESVERHHVLIEAMKLALADRDHYVSDPAAMTIDAAALASGAWADRRRGEIDRERAGLPAAGRSTVGGTVYLCAADAQGMLVSLIQSNYEDFGSGVTVPAWGINLQNRGADFSLDAGHVNAIGPRKRTMHTLMPAMASRDGRPWLVFGTMGGDGQAQTHLQFLSRVIDDGADIQDAIDAPRWLIFPSQWSVLAESRFPPGVTAGLRARGHRLDETGAYDRLMGHAHAIEVTDDGYACATDPRAEGAALGL